MAVRRLALEQPASFAFTPASKAWCDSQIAKYPAGRQASAVIPLLWKAQAQNSYWLPKPAIECVAAMLGMPYIRVLEIATFYSMFNLEPVGRYFIQLCGTTPCMLRGSNDIRAVCEKRIGEQRKPTRDGLFAWAEVECLGACCNAPMVQVNDDYFEDLDPASFSALLDDLASGRPVKKGSQVKRVSSEPMPGPVTTLMEAGLFDGSVVGAWKARFEERAKAAAPAKAAAAAPPASALPTSPAVGASTAAAIPAAAASSAPDAIASPTSGSAPVMTAEAAKGAPAPAAASAAATLAPVPVALDAMPAAAPASRPDAMAYPALPPMIVAALRPALLPDHAAEDAANAISLAALPKDASAEQKADAVGQRPTAREAARAGVADDLKRVKGIGKVNEAKLNALGTFHFDQIASWGTSEIGWMDGNLKGFRGRVTRDKWVAQAKLIGSEGIDAFRIRTKTNDY